MKKEIIVTAIISILLGLCAGYFLFTGNDSDITNSHQKLDQVSSDENNKKILFYRNPMNPAITSPTFQQDEMGMDYIPVYAEEKKAKEKKILFYRNPMNPAITSPIFQQDEMGMDYIPVYEGGDADDETPTGTVTINPEIVQNIGVRTALVKRQNISRRINALGKVDFNEEKLARLHPKTSGWIEKLLISETGKQVKKDSILLNIYSPDLVAAQREYLVALKNWESLPKTASARLKQTTKTLLDTAFDRLELLDVPKHQLIELKVKRKINKYLHIHSPFQGTIMNIGARKGQYVTPQQELYLVADLQKVWVHVDIYEDEITWVKLGDQVEMKVRAVPGRIFKGKVKFIYPYLDGKTRTVRIRLDFDNNDYALKPGMFANVILHADDKKNALVVPSEAIVRSGQKDQVFVVRAPGKFEPREIVSGLSAGGLTQIISGVDENEEIVTSSTFLIDSESKLNEATAKMMKAMSMQQGKSLDAEMSMDHMSMEGMNMDDMDMGDMNMDDMSMDNMNMEVEDSTKASSKMSHEH